jgi:SAM-dependent methyltransferase
LARQPFDSEEIADFLTHQYEGRAKLSSLRGFDYEVVRCRECTLAFQRTIPSDALVNEIYEHWIPASEKDRLADGYTLDVFRYMGEQMQFLIQHFGRNPYHIRVFDFGMGWGEWASMARAFGCQVTGAELSLVRLQHAKSIGIETIGWDDIPNRRFDYINTEQVFEHLIHPLDTLKHLAQALNAGGLIKISVPDSRYALRRLEKSGAFGSLAAKHKIPVQPLEHVNCFEFASLAALARQAGLRPLRPKLRLLYNSSSGWLSPKQAARLLLRPIYRHWFPKSTFVYFVRER